MSADLGPLPEPYMQHGFHDLYTADQMRAYAAQGYAAGVAAETGRQSEVIRHLNARCDHLGMALRDAKAAGVAAAEACGGGIEEAGAVLSTRVVWLEPAVLSGRLLGGRDA